ncbi:phosphoglycerate mutase family protein [Pontimicrobium sp. SW4]|uniref:Phosphoglycerate mutase family protein n=1 Tax=Pontimicrobium sp. SW4 TaxID=3153519 RepID=A0AAU7BPF2_9FLAO
MKNLIILLLVAIFTLPSNAQDMPNNEEITTYYFIRHAEKNRSDKTNKDPKLKQKGVLRAAKWSLVFENITFDAVYSTDYNRTKQTAQPTAEKKGLEVTIYDPRQLFSEEFANNTKGKTVLIVGHSNTTPAFVNAVLGTKKYNDMDDNNNANLYIVTISPSGEKSDTLLVID